jgi:hypothetical protein
MPESATDAHTASSTTAKLSALTSHYAHGQERPLHSYTILTGVYGTGVAGSVIALRARPRAARAAHNPRRAAHRHCNGAHARAHRRSAPHTSNQHGVRRAHDLRLSPGCPSRSRGSAVKSATERAPLSSTRSSHALSRGGAPALQRSRELAGQGALILRHSSSLPSSYGHDTNRDLSATSSFASAQPG